MSSFESLGLLPELIQAVEEHGWLLPKDVQDESIPLILGGNHVMISAETGSGKTGALALPILQLLYEGIYGHASITKPGSDDASCVYIKTDPRTNEQYTHMALTQAGRNITLDESCTVAEAMGKGWDGARSNLGVSRGKWYWEVTAISEGVPRIGVGLDSSRLIIGSDKASWGYGGTGKKSHNNEYVDYGGPYELHDVIGVYLDCDTGTLAYVNVTKKKDLGVAYELPKKSKFYPSVAMNGGKIQVNFGPTFANTNITKGFQAISEYKEKYTPPSANTSSSASKDTTSQGPLCIVFEPTRELAVQIYDELKQFSKYIRTPDGSPLHIGLVTAGKDPRITPLPVLNSQHILVCTTGSYEHASASISLSNMQFLVLDEADAYISDNFVFKTITNVYQSTLRNSRPVQNVICSATLHSPDMHRLIKALDLENASRVDLKGKDNVPENVDHVAYYIDASKDISWLPRFWTRPVWALENKEHYNTQIYVPAEHDPLYKASMAHLKDTDIFHTTDPQTLVESFITNYTDKVHNTLLASDTSGFPSQLSFGTKILKLAALKRVLDTFMVNQCIIFCRTQVDCENVSRYLTYCDTHKLYPSTYRTIHTPLYSNTVLHGGANNRSTNYAKFKAGQVKYIVCTDVAARGLDIKDLPLVINYTLPDNTENYVHRVGRTGRAGKYGMAISLVSQNIENVWFHTCRSRGANCNNVGCIIEYDEQTLLSDIEERIQQDIPIVYTNDIFKGKQHVFTYAEGKRPVRNTAGDVHVAILEPQSRQLYEYELQAQKSWMMEQILANKWKEQMK